MRILAAVTSSFLLYSPVIAQPIQTALPTMVSDYSLGNDFQVIPATIDPNIAGDNVIAAATIDPAEITFTMTTDDVHDNLIAQTKTLSLVVGQFVLSDGKDTKAIGNFAEGVLGHILGFALGGTSSSDPLLQFEQDVESRLVQIAQDLAQMEASINEILTITNAISIQLDDATLQETLREMATGPLPVIESAYETLISYASVIADSANATTTIW